MTTVASADAPLLAPPAGGRHGSLYSPPPAETYERIVISSAFRLFDDAWSYELLRRLSRGLQPEGRLLVPFQGAEPSRRGFLSLARVEELFGQKGRLVGATGDGAKLRGHVEVVKADVRPPFPSLLDWFMDEGAALAGELVELSGRPGGEVVELAARAPFVRTVETHDAGRWVPPATLVDATASLVYLMGGVTYKTPVLASLIRDHFNGRTGLGHLDLGSGPGWVGAELALDPRTGVEWTENLDIAPVSAVQSMRMFARYPELDGRFTLHVAKMEDFAAAEPPDVVTFLGGTLIYVPEVTRLPLLQRAWASLRPGGFLAVLENVRSPRFARDYERMLDAAELDALLEPFGEVERFAANTGARLSVEASSDRTAFRLVRKPG